MPPVRKIARVLVALLLLQANIAAAGAFDCASCTEPMDGDSPAMTHESMGMVDAAETATGVDPYASMATLTDRSADSHGVACITMLSCASIGGLPSTRALEAPPGHTAGVILQPAPMVQSPGAAPEVPPPRA